MHITFVFTAPQSLSLVAVYALHSQIHSPIFCPNGKKICRLTHFLINLWLMQHKASTASAQNYLKGPGNIYENIFFK